MATQGSLAVPAFLERCRPFFRSIRLFDRRYSGRRKTCQWLLPDLLPASTISNCTPLRCLDCNVRHRSVFCRSESECYNTSRGDVRSPHRTLGISIIPAKRLHDITSHLWVGLDGCNLVIGGRGTVLPSASIRSSAVECQGSCEVCDRYDSACTCAPNRSRASWGRRSGHLYIAALSCGRIGLWFACGYSLP